MHHYRAYGLQIASELPLPELLAEEGEGAHDLVVRLGDLRGVAATEPGHSRNRYLGEGRLLVEIQGVARYLVAGGGEIVVDPEPGADAVRVRVFLLGSAFGAILHQRGFLPIHGNGVEIGGRCIIFAGHSGRGKSTLAAAFANRGYRLLSDDLCAIRLTGEGEATVLPGYPHVKLWRDTLLHLNENAGGHQRVHPEEEKFLIPAHAAHCGDSLPLRKIYTLRFSREEGIRFEPLSRLDAMVALKNYTYRYRMLEKMGLGERHHYQCARLLESVPLSRLFRPRELGLLDTLIDRVIEGCG